MCYRIIEASSGAPPSMQMPSGLPASAGTWFYRLGGLRALCRSHEAKLHTAGLRLYIYTGVLACILPRHLAPARTALDLSPHFYSAIATGLSLVHEIASDVLVIGLTIAASSPVYGMQANLRLGGRSMSP